MDDQTLLATDQPRASLVVRQGAHIGATYSIISAEAILGRDEEADVSVRDPEVSRRHARISWQSGNYYVEDLGSTNGTFLNGALVTSPQPLRSGDTIGVGQTLLVFQMMGEPIPVQPAAAPAYSPPIQPSPTAPAVERKSGGSRCLLWGCGCLILLGLLLIVLAGVAMLLFAQQLQPIFDELGIPVQLTMLFVTNLPGLV